MQNIPTELLRTFVKAIDSGSFTRAAELVGRSQSAVSLQIRRLEEVVDARLFQRDAHKLQLTPEGKSLAQFARRILALNDEALASLRQPSVAGRVRLGAPHEYTASLLPEFLGKFAQSHPNVMLEVTSDLSKNLLRRQQNGEFDLVIALHDESSTPDGERIFTEPLVWITSADHARHEQDPLPLVVAPPPCIYRHRMLQALNQLGQPCRIVYLSSSYNGISAAVLAGLGVTVMAGSTTPQGVRILGEQDGLPSLGQLELRLHRTPHNSTEAIARLEHYIAESFAGAGLVGDRGVGKIWRKGE
ncbi:LysR substrate-binding domain-containing protein [Rubellimicrobium mesophilum]|nr:LysR substrate-binding domain-containing protein [Rubellimicrobium mesophilum]